MSQAWTVGFWLGVAFVGMLVGMLAGIVPAWAGYRRRQPALGIAGFGACCIAGAVGNAVTAVPVSLFFAWLISKRARRAATSDAAPNTSPQSPAGSPRLTYAGLGAAGLNDGWRYAASGMCIAYMWFIVGVTLAGGLAFLSPPGVSPYWTLAAVLSAHVPMLLGVALAVGRFHRRSLMTLVNTVGRVRWAKAARALGIWAAIIAALSAVELVLRPGHAVYTLELSKWLPFALFAFPLLVLQSAAEEFLFRGYLFQSLSVATRRRAVVILASSLLFAAVHIPASLAIAVYYVGFGVFLTWVVVRDQGLEAAIGIHVGHNVMAMLFIPSVDDFALLADLPAVFRATVPNDAFSLAQLGLAMLVFTGLYFGLGKRAHMARPVGERVFSTTVSGT
ncbi:MAG: type II CAAX endopeptidase family protein [Bacillota bacterium]|nr:type II CAAX endopeptidase family protein [Bacillota bacterium]